MGKKVEIPLLLETWINWVKQEGHGRMKLDAHPFDIEFIYYSFIGDFSVFERECILVWLYDDKSQIDKRLADAYWAWANPDDYSIIQEN